MRKHGGNVGKVVKQVREWAEDPNAELNEALGKVERKDTITADDLAVLKQKDPGGEKSVEEELKGIGYQWNPETCGFDWHDPNAAEERKSTETKAEERAQTREEAPASVPAQADTKTQAEPAKPSDSDISSRHGKIFFNVHAGRYEVYDSNSNDWRLFYDEAEAKAYSARLKAEIAAGKSAQKPFGKTAGEKQSTTGTEVKGDTAAAKSAPSAKSAGDTSPAARPAATKAVKEMPVKMKDAESEKKARELEDELAALFFSDEFDPERADYEKRLRDIIAKSPRDAKGRLLSPNGKPTNLTERQYAMVRTPEFKRWFGDWEALAELTAVRDFLLNSKPVTEISGTEFQKDNVSLVDKVSDYFATQYDNRAVSPELGEVILDKRGVKSSMAHGIGATKAAAYAVVHDVIEKGKVFDRQNNWKGRGKDTAVIAAPVRIGEKDYICEVVVESSGRGNEFYLHEVNLKEKIAETIKTPTGGAASAIDARPSVRSIFAQKWARVNPASVSKVVDENGEPKVVYHGTPRGGHTVFDPDKSKNGDEANDILFDSPEFDPEAFQKRVGVLAKLAKTYLDSGVAEFKTLAMRLNYSNPDKFNGMKPYLRGIWNAVAEQMDLPEVSKSEANEIYDKIESTKETDNGLHHDRTSEAGAIQRHNDTDARITETPSGVSSEGNDSDAQAEDAGQNASRSGEDGDGAALPLRGESVRQGQPVVGSEVADGTVPAGGAVDQQEVAEGSAAVARRDGRPVEDHGRPAEGGESLDGVESGLPRDVGRGDEAGSGSGARKGESTRPTSLVVREELTEKQPNAVKNENYIITPEDEAFVNTGTPQQKVAANIKAIRIVRRLAEEGRDATPEEKQHLARYVGWGGLSQVFDPAFERAYAREQETDEVSPQTWAAIRKTRLGEQGYEAYKQLRELLTEEELSAAQSSTVTAFFTPIRLCRIINAALKKAGLEGGRFLETSAGVGNFIGTGEYVDPRWTAVELDVLSGQILKALYPKASVRISGYEDLVAPDNFYDAAISNVPFSNGIHPYDSAYAKYSFPIHDFFFAKSIDKIRPGGVMAFITDVGTLDRRDKKIIRFLSEHGGKIIGAIRMPNGMFAKNAGTDVSSDLIIIQKQNGTADNSQFMETAEVRGCPVADWFVKHPELCLGEMRHDTNQWGNPKMRYAATGRTFEDIEAALAKVTESLSYTPAEANTEAPRVVELPDANGLVIGNVTVANGKIVRKAAEGFVEIPGKDLPGVTVQLKKRGVTPAKIVKAVESLRKAFRDLVDAQMAACSDAELKKLQDALNYEYSTFVSRYGHLKDRLIEKFIKLDYASGELMLGMETVKKDGAQTTYSKADIFTKRTIFSAPKATSAANVMDGLRISLNERGTVDVKRIAELTGRAEADVRKELIETGRVFVNPETNGLETHDEYLSGSVRKKLKAAQAAATIDESFKKNVEELEKVQPDDVPATDISYQLGQKWIPLDVYTQFFKESLFGGTADRLTVSYDEREKKWTVNRASGTTEYDEQNAISMEDLLERMMNSQSIVVRRHLDDGTSVVDGEATKATKIVAEKIAKQFQSWMTDDVDRANRIERIYNDLMNDNVPRQWDTDILEFNGLSEQWHKNIGTKGREYQKRCIARGTFGGNLLIAHCVGAGKTFEMASICMQLRRLGIARKPMFAVPNHMLEQWHREFHEAYPAAKVLVASKDDLAKNKRRAFLAKAATGDWDCIIVAHSSFSRIAMSPEHQAEYVRGEIAELEDIINSDDTDKQTRKKIEKRIQSLLDKLKALLDPSKKDDKIKFEEIGCDYLFVDEAHNFKGLNIKTRMTNVPGVTGSVSKRAQDLEMKCRYIAKLHGGDKGVVFVTGTPISNSISEMYVMMRYLAPTKIKEMDLYYFDNWAAQFGVRKSVWGPNPSGVGYRVKERFSEFQNVPEMKKFFRSFTDVVLDSELNIKRPFMLGGKPIQHIIKPSETTKSYIDSLNERMERLKAGGVDPTKDNMLKITTEGRLLAIDPMLLGVKDDSHARANACADEVKRIYDKSTGKWVKDRDGKDIQINGTQLIFCDSGVPKKKQFKQLIQTSDGGYSLASGTWTLRVSAPDASGKRHAVAECTDGESVTIVPVADHSSGGFEDLASVYTALEQLQSLTANIKKPKGTKKAGKPVGTAVDINRWLDENSDRIGYDPRFYNPFAQQQMELGDNAESVEEPSEEEPSEEEQASEDDKDTSEEANGDAEVDNMLRGRFNMYAEIRRQLIRRGIPANEIAYIHDAETMTQKQALFDRMKKGEIRVLIGNTAKMGEGTNVQDRLVAIHHFDIPWKPAWLTQRNGRGIRSGNLNDEIGIHTYITGGTFDAYSWDTVTRKAKFIEVAMSRQMGLRKIEDVDTTILSLEEGTAAGMGDPRHLERAKLVSAIENAQSEYDIQVKASDRAALKYRAAERELARKRKETTARLAAIERYQKAKEGKDFTLTTMEEKPRELKDNKAIAQYLQQKLSEFTRRGTDVGIVGNIFGFDVRYQRGKVNGVHFLWMPDINVAYEFSVFNGNALFTDANVSKLKGEITSATGQRAIDYINRNVERSEKALVQARKGVENLSSFDRAKAERDIGKQYRELAHLNRALGITDSNVRDVAATFLRGEREDESARQAAALAVASPAEDNAVFADVPMDAKLRVMENDMAEADFSSPEFDSDEKKRIGVTQREIDERARNLGVKPWRHRKTTWPEVYQKAEALINSGKFVEELAADVAKYNRPVSAEQILALKRHLIEAEEHFGALRELRRNVEKDIAEAGGEDMDFVRSLKAELDGIKEEEAKLSRLYHTAHVASKAAASKTGLALAANRAQFDEEFNFLGMKEARRDALGRELTPQELKELSDICEQALDLTDEGREILWAAVRAQAEKTIRDLFHKNEIERATTTRKGDEYAKYRKKYNDAMAHLKVYANSVGGSLVGISGDEYGTWNKPLFDILLWHRFVNPDISAAEALQAVVEDVNTYVEADANTVARLLTGFERSWDINRHDDVLRGGRDLRAQILTDLQIGKLLNKEMAGKTGPIQEDPSAELREKRHMRDVLKADLEDETNDPRKLQSRQKRWLKWYDNRIEEMLREIAAGERLPQTKRTLAWTEEMTRKREEYEALKAERDLVCGVNELSEEEKIARYEKSLEKTLRRAIERLQRARNDDFRKAKSETVSSEYIRDLQAAIRETNEAIRQEKKDRLNYGRTQEELEKFNAAREKRRLERIQYWQSLTVPEADRSTQKRKEIYMPPDQKARYDAAGEQLKKLRRQVLDMRARDELAKRPWAVRQGIEYFKFINNMTRCFLATADHSAVLRQMAQLSMSHPLIAARVFKETLGVMFSSEQARRIDDEYRNDPRIKEAIDKGWLNWRDIEATGGVNDVEMFSGSQSGIDVPFTRDENGRPKRLHLDDIKGVGWVLHGSERIYATYVNVLSAEIYLSLINADNFTAQLLFGQNGLTDFAKKEIAARINMANGSAHIEKGENKQFMKKLTSIFWAPKLALSRAQLVVGYDIWHPLLSKDADMKTKLRVAGLNAIEHARARLAMIALGTLMLMLAGDDDDKDKWKRAGWVGKYLQSIAPRIGNTTLDYSGGEIGWYRLLAKWVTLTKESGTGKTMYLADTDGHKQSFGADLMGETWRFLQGKFNPLLSNAIALRTGKDYVGKEFGWKEYARNTFLPLGANDTVQSFAENGLGRGLLLAPFITLGAGGNTYEPKRYDIAVNQFKEVVKQYDDVRADRSISSDERMETLNELLRDNPILRNRAQIESKLQMVKYFEGLIRKQEKMGVKQIPKSLTEGLEKSRNAVLELIRKSR